MTEDKVQRVPLEFECHVPRDWIEKFRAHGMETYPEECCGVMLGHLADASGVTRVVRAVRAENQREDEARHNRFLIEPRTILQSQRDGREEGLDIVGYYHSHPDHPAKPSDFDREHAWPEQSYVIVSIRDGKAADLRSWRLSDDRSKFLEERVLTI